MKPFAIVSACLLSGLVVPSRAPADSPKSPPPPTVQIALLLDTSNSMDGLIAQAKTQLWNVVNEFVKAKKDGRPPVIQVALFEYGKRTLSPTEGYVRLILPLTDDLDKVSEELFALKTNGGDEYCGWVIREAAKRLEWGPSDRVYKAIFIAGNAFRSIGVIEALEEDLGRPVLTANQVALWYALRLADVGAQVEHYGQVFTTLARSPTESAERPATLIASKANQTPVVA